MRMTHPTAQSALIAVILLIPVYAQAESVKPTAATRQDRVGNVEYVFNEEASIKVAPA